MHSAPKKLILFILLLVAFIDWMGIGLVYPMFSSMMFHHDINLIPPESSDALRGFWLGILLALMPLSQFFSSPIIGALSDQKGRKPLLKYCLIFGVVGYAIAMLAVWMESLALMLFSRVVLGISAGSAAVVGASLADLSLAEEKAKNFGLLNMAAGIGFTVGPFFGGKLSAEGFLGIGGYDMPFLFAGLITLLNLLLLLYFFKETHQHRRQVSLSISQGISNLKKAFRLPGIRILFITVFIFCFGWSFYWEFIPVTWINEYGMSASDVGDLFAYAAAFYALSCGLLIGPVVKRVRPPAVLFYSLVLAGFYILILLSHPGKNFLWGFLPLQQFLIALLFPTAAAMVSNYVKEDAQGEMMGILQSVEAGAVALSPLLSGVFVGLNYDMPIIVGACAFLAAAAILGTGVTKEVLKWRA
ncbi:MAG: MFS transporter [Verrucomicrobia bacterium]|nr:MFS transporter [Verrucomicrobiota bacterium]